MVRPVASGPILRDVGAKEPKGREARAVMEVVEEAVPAGASKMAAHSPVG
jgi:hypothetical protein